MFLDPTVIRGLNELNKKSAIQGFQDKEKKGVFLKKGLVDVKMLNLLHNIDDADLEEFNIQNIHLYFQPIHRMHIEMITNIIKKKKLNWISFRFCNLTKELVGVFNDNLKDGDEVCFRFIYFQKIYLLFLVFRCEDIWC